MITKLSAVKGNGALVTSEHPISLGEWKKKAVRKGRPVRINVEVDSLTMMDVATIRADIWFVIDPRRVSEIYINGEKAFDVLKRSKF
jgi:hypothetical protein